MICQDDLGKEAVRDGLKLIKLKNVKTKPEMSISFAGGVAVQGGRVSVEH